MSAEAATQQEIESEQQQPEEQPKRRIGRFQISLAPITHDWRCLLPIFSRVVILRAEMMAHLGAIDYIALSDEFEAVDINDAPPAYRIHCSSEEGGEESLQFVRVQ